MPRIDSVTGSTNFLNQHPRAQASLWEKKVKIPASVPLSLMLKLGKVITPKTDFVTLTLEEFLSRTRDGSNPFK